MAKSTSYWDKRALNRLKDAEKMGDKYIKQIKAMYTRSYRNIDKELASIYKNYSIDTGLDTNKLKELLSKKETDKTWKTLKRQGYDKYIQDNYKSRISRAEQLQAQIYAKIKLLDKEENDTTTDLYNGVINDSYYKAVYDTQMGTGYDFTFNKIDKRLINSLLSERWSGKNYSERIWGNTDILANSVSEIIGGALLSGQSISKTSKQIRDRYNVGKYYSERLVRTETNHFNNLADAMAYEDMGIDKYVFVATLDSRTSEICRDMDNKVFEYKDLEEGVNFPPLHPNCRSKTRGYLGADGEKELKRRARNPITGKTEIVDNMSYKEWAKQNGIPLKDNKPEEKPKPKAETKPQNVDKPLTKSEKDALEYYVSGEGMFINNNLRGLNSVELNEKDKQYLKDLDSATTGAIVKDKVLYRSVDASAIFPNISNVEYENLTDNVIYGENGKLVTDSVKKLLENKNTEFTDKGFVSTTKDFNIAKEWGDFTGSDKPVVLELNIGKDVKGRDLDFLDLTNDPQKEVLLARNQYYKVGDIYNKDGAICVKVDVLPKAKEIPKEIVKETPKVQKNTWKNFDTIDEADRYVRQKYDIGSSIIKLKNVDNVNTTLETLDDLQSKYELHKNIYIDTKYFKNAGACANHRHITLNQTVFNKKEYKGEYGAKYQKGIQKQIDDITKNYLGNPQYKQSSVDKALRQAKEMIQYKCQTIASSCRNQADHLRGIVSHEYGHVVADQYFGQINKSKANINFSYNDNNPLWKKCKLVTEAYKKAIKDGDIYDISYYASTNDHEFFAEVFCKKYMGGKLPKYIDDMLEEVLK